MHTLEIENFKCFNEAKLITINNLTLLVGVNSIGKSSVIQALNFIHKAYNTNAKIINNNDIETDSGFGKATDLINDDCSSNSFSICISDDYTGDSAQASFFSCDDDSHALGLAFDKNHNSDIPEILGPEIYYLSAERLGPRISSGMIDMPYLRCGIHGENTAQVLASNGGLTKVDPDRMYPGSTNQFLDLQVRKWLDHILPGTDLVIHSDLNLLRCQTRITRHNGEMRTPTNVGFGISYLLPIITDCLVAKKGRLVIIENPEAHLHPAAQTKVGMMLAHMAKSGLNIIAETHSEHIIEGVQLFAAQNQDFRLGITINFFEEKPGTTCPKIKDISLTESFSYSSFPKGFLDESSATYMSFRNAIINKK